MKKKIIVLSSVAICAVLIVIGATFAHFTSKDSVTNVFNTGSINAVPEEEVEGTTKKVWVKNTGDNDCFVRVSITPRWVDEDGNVWAGDVSNSVVQLGFNNDNIITGEPWTASKWIKDIDGFYYYTSILPVDEITSELLSTVTVSIRSNTVDYPEDYNNKTLKVDVKVEAVQTTQNAYRTVWSIEEGTTIDNLFSSLTTNN